MNIWKLETIETKPFANFVYVVQALRKTEDFIAFYG